jgi:hypothetical protein
MPLAFSEGQLEQIKTFAYQLSRHLCSQYLHHLAQLLPRDFGDADVECEASMGSGGPWTLNAYSAPMSNLTRLDPNRSDVALMIRSHDPGTRGHRSPAMVDVTRAHDRTLVG